MSKVSKKNLPFIISAIGVVLALSSMMVVLHKQLVGFADNLHKPLRTTNAHFEFPKQTVFYNKDKNLLADCPESKSKDCIANPYNATLWTAETRGASPDYLNKLYDERPASLWFGIEFNQNTFEYYKANGVDALAIEISGAASVKVWIDGFYQESMKPSGPLGLRKIHGIRIEPKRLTEKGNLRVALYVESPTIRLPQDMPERPYYGTDSLEAVSLGSMAEIENAQSEVQKIGIPFVLGLLMVAIGIILGGLITWLNHLKGTDRKGDHNDAGDLGRLRHHLLDVTKKSFPNGSKLTVLGECNSASLPVYEKHLSALWKHEERFLVDVFESVAIQKKEITVIHVRQVVSSGKEVISPDLFDDKAASYLIAKELDFENVVVAVAGVTRMQLFLEYFLSPVVWVL